MKTYLTGALFASLAVGFLWLAGFNFNHRGFDAAFSLVVIVIAFVFGCGFDRARYSSRK